jgi:N-ethylmaleimide reductase
MNKNPSQSDLFKPVQLGSLRLSNRIVMAPLTRSRAGKGDAPGPLNAEYYAQRASAGLIVSEATNISQQGKGYAFTPGIYTEGQVEGWRQVTAAVHEKGGRIFCQLWHVGRISHPSLQPGGELPVAPSAIRPNQRAFTERGMQDCVTPRALRSDEIPGIVEQYRHAAACAKRAGFDGAEVHGANGYLLHQFLSDQTNHRMDAYGGSVENRSRLALEVVSAVAEVWGGDRVGIRLSPVTPANDIGDSDPMAIFSYLVDQLNRFDLAYLHVVEGATGGSRGIVPGFDFQALRRKFRGPYMANNGYDLELALEAREKGLADLICFGRPFIANPDLVERLRSGAPLNPPDPKTFYGGGAKGYTDYPFLATD